MATEQDDQESSGLQKYIIVREVGRHVWHRREKHKSSHIRVWSARFDYVQVQEVFYDAEKPAPRRKRER
jgi:hypothetical protein